MKENKYDDAVFFEKYRKMPRSQQGLNAAGEWNELRKLLPAFEGKKVLDLGCGYGWHCIYAAQNGATAVVGSDISSKMLEVAAEQTASPIVQYQCSAMEDLSFASGSFDIVISSLALHYIADFPDMIRKISQWLVPGGDLVFSMEHPIFTAHGTQDWHYDERGKIMHFPVDRYFDEASREACFLGEKVTKYHRTFTTIINSLLSNGFHITSVIEPQPPAEMMDIPGMRDELRRPMMMLVAAKKR